MKLLLDEDACIKNTEGACEYDSSQGLGKSAGVISWTCAMILLVAILLLCFGTGKRQRKRMRKWTADGDRRPREDRDADMSLWIPFFAYTGLLTTLLVYAARVTFNPSAAFRMDSSGDGECGSNATQFDKHGGCLSGVPEGYMYGRCMADLVLIGIGGALITLEAAGRPRSRILVSVWSLTMVVLTIIKFALWDAWKKQVGAVGRRRPL